MASLRKRLQNLFGSNIIIRPKGNGRLGIVDTNKLQSIGRGEKHSMDQPKKSKYSSRDGKHHLSV